MWYWITARCTPKPTKDQHARALAWNESKRKDASPPADVSTDRKDAGVPIDCKNCGAYSLCMSLWLKTGDSSLLERVVKKKQVFKRGEVLYRMGQAVEYIYVIRGGAVKTCVGTEEGQVQVMGFHAAGELLGSECPENACSIIPRRVQREQLRFVKFRLSVLRNSLSKDPAIQYEIFKIMSAEIRRGQELLLLLGKHNAEERLAAFLLGLSQQFAKRNCSATEFYLSYVEK